MGKYRIEFKKSAVKEIRKLSGQDVKKIIRSIEALSNDPRPVGSSKLSGGDCYRIRCGDYRILYKIEDGLLIVCVIKVGHRKEVYR